MIEWNDWKKNEWMNTNNQKMHEWIWNVETKKIINAMVEKD